MGNAQGDTCCICIEIGLGMKIMGVLSCLSAIFMMIMPVLNFVLLNSIVMLAIALIAVYGGFLWFKWLRNDEAETRKGAILACALNVVSNLISAIWTLINMLIMLNFTMGGFLTLVTNSIIMMLFSFYFYTVARRYSIKQGDSIGEGDK